MYKYTQYVCTSLWYKKGWQGHTYTHVLSHRCVTYVYTCVVAQVCDIRIRMCTSVWYKNGFISQIHAYTSSFMQYTVCNHIHVWVWVLVCALYTHTSDDVGGVCLLPVSTSLFESESTTAFPDTSIGKLSPGPESSLDSQGLFLALKQQDSQFSWW